MTGLLRRLTALTLVTLAFAVLPAVAGAQDESSDEASPPVDPELFSTLEYRSIGPLRGGRSTAVTGIPGRPKEYLMGSTGGGVWKTHDAGLTWNNISDGFFNTASVGAIAVAPSDLNVISVGTGSACIRGNATTGVVTTASALDAETSTSHTIEVPTTLVPVRRNRQISSIACCGRVSPCDV